MAGERSMVLSVEGKHQGSPEPTLLERLHHRALEVYLRGRIGRAVEIYGIILEGYDKDRLAHSSLLEIVLLLEQIGRDDPEYSAARRLLRERIRHLLRSSGPALPADLAYRVEQG
jgi:hypothetical protein